MSSLSMRLMAQVARIGTRSTTTAAGMHRRVHGPKGDPTPPAALAERHTVEPRAVDGFTSYHLAPRHPAGRGVVIYLHGGGYHAEINRLQWRFAAQLVAEVGCQVEVPVYGLAPHHTPDEALSLLDAVHDQLLAAHEPRDIVLAGDSAGGGLALAFTQRLLTEGRPLPGRLVLLAPWLDLALDAPGIDELDGVDTMLSVEGGREAGRAWAGALDVADPRVSPIHGPMAGLPPIDVWVGTRDIMLPDCRTLRALVAAAGGTVELREHPGGIHVYVLVPISEGRRARRQIVEDLREHFRT